MQPSTTFDWGRVVTPARWIARILSGVPFVVWASLSLGHAFGSYPDLGQWVIIGAIGVGVLLASFWQGIGEVVGGLILVSAGIGHVFLYLPPGLGALAVASPFLIAGLLFIACGWYVLTQARHPAPHATA
jgi:hypothetical protein